MIKKKALIFSIIALTDLAISLNWKNGVTFFPVTIALGFIASLIWLGRFWNILFPPGAISIEAPTITKETPPLILAIFGWVLLGLLTGLLIKSWL